MPVLPSYRNQSIDLLCKSMDWFLYEGNITLSGLRNLPARLSTIVALLVLNSFNIFKIDTELTFSNLSWFFLRNLILFPIESGSFLTRSLARFAKCDIKKFVIVLGENVSSFFVGGHMLVVRSFKSAKPNFTKLFWFSYIFK